MPLTPAEPAIFRGVIALELRDGAPPLHPALAAVDAGELVTMLGRDLAALVPGVRDCDVALLAAHFDPAEALRPGWPLHRRASELLQRAPGQAQGARMVGFGADAAGQVPLPLQCEPDLQGGGLRILPFVLHGDAARDVGAALEELLLDRGMAAADTALALQEGLGAQVEHARFLSLHDLAAMIAMQYGNVGLDALWPLLETALLDPAAWRKRFAPAGESDCARLERGFEQYQARQRQFAAVLGAHAVPVNFVHCVDADRDCL